MTLQEKYEMIEALDQPEDFKAKLREMVLLGEEHHQEALAYVQATYGLDEENMASVKSTAALLLLEFGEPMMVALGADTSLDDDQRQRICGAICDYIRITMRNITGPPEQRQDSMEPKQSQNNPQGTTEHGAAGLLSGLLGQPTAPKSDFAQLMEGSVSMPAQVPEIADCEQPAAYPAENSVFTSITQYAPEPEPRRWRFVVCKYCGLADCRYSHWVED